MGWYMMYWFFPFYFAISYFIEINVVMLLVLYLGNLIQTNDQLSCCLKVIYYLICKYQFQFWQVCYFHFSSLSTYSNVCDVIMDSKMLFHKLGLTQCYINYQIFDLKLNSRYLLDCDLLKIQIMKWGLSSYFANHLDC